MKLDDHNVGETLSHEAAMNRAVEVATRGRGFVSPNPLVGCVIVDKHHKLLSVGAHLRYGGPHAEVEALQSLSDNTHLKDAIVYVTLEPCSHYGKTPPCAEALAKWPFKKVYYGLKDPNPLVAGKGLEKLRQAGIEVEKFPEEYQKKCQQLTEKFLYAMTHRRPFVSLKVGASLDGIMALNSGESQWITCEKSRLKARELRAHYDATVIGAGTLIHDNPKLDFRDTEFAGKKDNKIVIIDPKGKASDGFKETHLYKTHGPENIFILTPSEGKGAWEKSEVTVLDWTAEKDSWDHALKGLFDRGIHSLYVEGGAFVFGQILKHSLAQKLYLFQAPKILGKGQSWSKDFEIQSLNEAIDLEIGTTTSVGSSLFHQAYFKR